MPARLGPFIRQRSDAILGRWEKTIYRDQAPARGLTREQRIDNFALLIAEIAECADAAGASGDDAACVPPDGPVGHALHRLASGYDMPEIISEYAALRRIIISTWEEEVGPLLPAVDARILNQALDNAVAISIARFVQARERTLRALDRVALAALTPSRGPASLEATLLALCRALVETTPAADSATILLRDGEELEARASVGLEAEVAARFRVQIGRGFAGTIAASRDPLLLQNAAADPLLLSPYIREHGTRALYGVPLIDGGDVLGVAHMGSREASDFSEEDKLVFRALAVRAATVLVQAQLQERLRAREAEQRALAHERGLLLAEAERKTAELEAIINSMPDAVYIGDTTGIKRTNRRGLELLGAESSETLDVNVAELSQTIQVRSLETDEPVPADDLVFVRALRGETARSEVAHINLRTGQRVVVSSSAAPIRVSDQVVGAVAVNVDITARKEQERELRQRMDFEQQLIGIVSHDLRTPISTVMLTSQALLRQNRLDERQTKGVVRILTSSERASRMIDDLLDFTRARHTGIPVRRTHVDLHQIARRIVEEVALSFPHRDVVIDHTGNGEGEWDGDRLAQVVSNLTRNALTYSPAGTVVRVRTAGEAESAALEVHNGGMPIPADQLARIFEPMQRATNALGQARNIGLGLYIVRAIVRAHGGAVEVRSTADEGTTFTVRLPRRPAA